MQNPNPHVETRRERLESLLTQIEELTVDSATAAEALGLTRGTLALYSSHIRHGKTGFTFLPVNTGARVLLDADAPAEGDAR